MLLDREDLLNPTPEGGRGSDELALKRLEVPDALSPVDLSGLDACPKGLYLLGQGV
jgi:hypothetical protein